MNSCFANRAFMLILRMLIFSLFRTVTMPAPLTCLSFSTEGASLYAGTENGKFLVLDLRALDKPPKTVTVSENGDQIVAITVLVSWNSVIRAVVVPRF